MNNETNSQTPNNIVIYHAKCVDGLVSAYCFWKKYKDNALYIGQGDHSKLPDTISNLSMESRKSINIFIVDFSFHNELLKTLERDFKSLTILDHHITEKDNISQFNSVFNNNKSGAMLAFEFLNPETKPSKLIEYVMDQDLYKLSLPNCKPIINYIHTNIQIDSSFENIGKIEHALESELDKVIEFGITLGSIRNSQINYFFETRMKINFAGYEVYAVNGPRELRSDVGNMLAKLTNTFGVYFYIENNILKVSLRSVPEFDVSEIAVKLGGGGHKNASGIEFDFDVNSLFAF